jgi:DNA-binding transcriptional regulator YbjK
LADEGAKGLSHLKVDRRADVPDGTTSFYFRTRSALLLGVAQRVADLDHAALVSIIRLVRHGDATVPDGGPSQLANLVITAAQEPHLTRTKARYELMLQASRDAALAGVFQPNIDLFTELHRRIVSQLQPSGVVEVDTAVLKDQVAATMAFINGVGLSLAMGERAVDSAAQIDRLLSAILTGVVVTHRGSNTLADEQQTPEDSDRAG